MILLGTLEGVLVGIAQRWALHHQLPGISAGSWVGATALGAFVAWVLGMIPSTLMSLGAEATDAAMPEIADLLQYALAVPLGMVAGLILSFPQALVLRRWVCRWSLSEPVLSHQAPRALSWLPPLR